MRFLAVALLLALAATACGSTFSVSSTGDVDLLTADPEVAMTALGSFILRHDEELNCLYHDEPSNNGEPGTGGRVVIAWPEGYSAIADGNVVRILDGNGEAVATTGVEFQLGGGSIAGASFHCDAIAVWVTTGPPVTP